MNTHSSTPSGNPRPRPRSYDAASALAEAEVLANPVQLTRLVVGAAKGQADLGVLDSYLDWVQSWTATKATGMTEEERARQKEFGRPCDGRDVLYPGRPRVALDPERAAELGHPAADNEAHFRWEMLVHSGLYNLDLEYTVLRKVCRVGETQMRLLLHGLVWGTKQTRLRLTWHLLVLMLVNWGLEDTVTFVESGGNWLPEEIPEPEWYAEDGRIQVRSTSAGSVAGTAAPTVVYLRVALRVPGSPGQPDRDITLVWPPTEPRRPGPVAP